ncbi:3-isopropylmalate dehydratase large subunit [Candidimonas nitroreducens]|uniref:3-isopropylmalate dehydratase large subunit n=1 Tax=Candidimonas nitroreducens TaxID=683354 RepID=A0A225M6D9_9BURK|nr:3-isopropylmalate dehydratase large subunit [Candidimonas nitroreducens]OWT56904.1 3-isopropylmalate dehydratase large subunit [Candidimonas nitroreducens]
MGKTIAQKILESHVIDGSVNVDPGNIVRARVDLCLLNDINGPGAFRHFEKMGAKRVRTPENLALVVDHFAPAPNAQGARLGIDMRRFAKAKGIEHFYDLGKGGIEHTLVPELGLVGPGDIIVGGDSHTTTAGAFNAFGTGMSWAGIAAILALDETWFRVPESMRFNLRGKKAPFVTGKDIILKALQEIGTAGALYKSMEFVGPGLSDLNMDERMAICNMALEAGAKTGIVEPDGQTLEWAATHCKRPYRLISADADAEYESRYDFDLASVQPMVAKPYSPGNVVPVDEIHGVHVDQVYMGNCANGTITDLRQIASVLKGRKVAPGTRAIIVPATQAIYRQAMAEGLIDQFIESGAAVTTPTCGACFGGHNGALDDGEVAIATINRNFQGRAGHAGSQVYLSNSYVAAAAAVAGEIINPAAL